MDIDLQLRAMLVRQDPGEAFTDGVMQRLGDQDETLPSGILRLGEVRQRRQRRILWAGLLVLATAAATMLVLLRWRDPAPDFIAQVPPLSQADEPAPLPPPAPPESVDPVADPPTDAAREVVSPAESGIHIMVMQAVPRNGGEAEHVTIEAFRRLLMLELDALPGIIVHDAEYDADAAVPGGRTSRVVITALSEAVDLPTAPGEARVNAAIAFRGEAQPAYMGLTFIINAAGAKQGVNCEVRVRMGWDASNRGFSAAGQLISQSRCTTVADVAAALVAYVRPQFESSAPSTVAQIDDVLARLRDPSVDAAVRSQALWQLAVERVQGRGPELTADAVDTIAGYAAALPASERVQVWNRLGKVRDPALIDGLMRVAREDPDERVRLEVIALLASHASIPGVRTALEQVAQADTHATVRLAAARAIQDEATWRAHVLATLRDADLAPGERMSAFMHTIRTGSTPARRGQLRGLLADEAVLGDLIGLLRVGHADPLVGSSRILAVLGESGHPLVMDFFADLLLDDGQRAAGQVAADALEGLLAHKQDARVRAWLEKIAATHPERRTRDHIEVELASP